jgi:crotonobetaine/carnitine-CoA ligase
MSNRIDFPGRIRSPHTTVGSGRNVPWLLELRSRERASHPFLVWEPTAGPGRTWTYAEFASDVARLAAGLRRRGIGPGDRLVIHLDNCPEFLLAWFACVSLGAVAVCTNARSSRDELRYFAEHSEAVAAITQPGYVSLVESAIGDRGWIVSTSPAEDGDGDRPGRADAFESLLAEGKRGDPPVVDIDCYLPAWIQYTSGTTSRPKAVVLTHANALWGAKVSAAHEALTRDDIHLIQLPLFHINALCYSTLASLWVGGAVVLQPGFSASRFWDVAVRNRCTWTSVAPFCVRALLKHEVPPRHWFRLWGNGFSSPPEDEIFRVRTLAWYGMTETVSHPVMDEAGMPGRQYGMGRPMPEYEVAVLDADGMPVAPGATGDIFVRGLPGLSLFAGYLHDETATKEAVDADGWLRTGDRVTVHEDGFMTFADRDKDMLKVGGENVAASEVERIILTCPGVVEVAVVAKRHPMLDEVPVAFVVADGERPDLVDRIAAACRDQLSDFKVPREIRIVDDFPRSTLNKIAKAELRRALASEERSPS